MADTKTNETWKQRVKKLTQELYVIYLACKDPRVPWYAKLVAFCVVAYAFSPIDFIPDFIPVLGYLDDLVLVPLGIVLVIKLIPSYILEEYREKAADIMKQGKPRNWAGAIIIIGIWILAILLTIRLIRFYVSR